MTIALSILAGLLLLIGFVGCVVPILPGQSFDTADCWRLFRRRSVRQRLFWSRWGLLSPLYLKSAS